MLTFFKSTSSILLTPTFFSSLLNYFKNFNFPFPSAKRIRGCSDSLLNGLDTVQRALLFKDRFLIAHSYLNLTYLQLGVMRQYFCLQIKLDSSKGLVGCRQRDSRLKKIVHSSITMRFLQNKILSFNR